MLVNRSTIIHQQPIIFTPDLARNVGLNAAIVLQKLEFLLNTPRCGKEIDGKKWIYNTYSEWQRDFFPFWSQDTIMRTFQQLEKAAFVEAIQPEGRGSRVKYYRVTEAGLMATGTKNLPEKLPDTDNLLPSGDTDNLRVSEDRNLSASCAGASNYSESPEGLYSEKEQETTLNTPHPATAGNPPPSCAAPPPSVALARMMDRARKWFNRRASTKFDDGEMRALRSASKLEISDDDLELLDRWFALPKSECFEKYRLGRKCTISSAFNSIMGELEKAKQAFSDNSLTKHCPQKSRLTTITTSEYLQWLNSQDFGDRMKPEWRNPETAPRSLVLDFLEYQNEPTF